MDGQTERFLVLSKVPPPLKFVDGDGDSLAVLLLLDFSTCSPPNTSRHLLQRAHPLNGIEPFHAHDLSMGFTRHHSADIIQNLSRIRASFPVLSVESPRNLTMIVFRRLTFLAFSLKS